MSMLLNGYLKLLFTIGNSFSLFNVHTRIQYVRESVAIPRLPHSLRTSSSTTAATEYGSIIRFRCQV